MSGELKSKIKTGLFSGLSGALVTALIFVFNGAIATGTYKEKVDKLETWQIKHSEMVDRKNDEFNDMKVQLSAIKTKVDFLAGKAGWKEETK